MELRNEIFLWVDARNKDSTTLHFFACTDNMAKNKWCGVNRRSGARCLKQCLPPMLVGVAFAKATA